MKSFKSYDSTKLTEVIDLLKNIRYFPERVNLFELDALIGMHTEHLEEAMEPLHKLLKGTDIELNEMQHPIEVLHRVWDCPDIFSYYLQYEIHKERIEYLSNLREDYFKEASEAIKSKYEDYKGSYAEYQYEEDHPLLTAVLLEQEVDFIMHFTQGCVEPGQDFMFFTWLQINIGRKIMTLAGTSFESHEEAEQYITLQKAEKVTEIKQ